MAEAAAGGASWATDLAEALVLRGVPFRDAHEAVGSLVAELEEKGLALAAAPPSLLRAHHPLLGEGRLPSLDPAESMRRRSGHGGPAPERVDEQIEQLRAALTQARSAS
jgi:argininosuccinate lyase